MIEFDIDTQDLSSEFSLTKQEVDGMLSYAVQDVASRFADIWATEVKQGLSSARNEYLNNIHVEQKDPLTAVVFLNPAAWLPNAIEMGKSGFDMKKGLLSSKKVKYGKNGKPYITVPFRFAVPSSLGENSAFSGVMPVEVHNEVKTQAPKQGLHLSKIPSQYHIPKNIGLRKQVKNGNFDNITSKTAKTSIYEGMQKTKGGYVTFRRVSLASDADRWIHPGFEARNFAGKAESRLNVPDIVDKAIDNYLAKLGF